jgi:hypothetical protein
MKDEKIPLLVIGPNSKNGTGSGTIRHFSKSERVTASIKKAGACLIGAVLGAFIPVLHFVIVPTLLLGALFSFIFTMKKKAQIMDASAKCPLCNQNLTVGKVPPEWPIATTCPGCSAELYVQDAGLPPLITISAH